MNDQDRVLEIFLWLWVGRGVMAAVEMDLFDLLAGEGLTLSEIERAMNLATRPARALADTCVAAGMLAKDGDRYRNTDLASRFLLSSSEHSVRNYVRDERFTWSAWGKLEEALRANAPPLAQDETGYRAPPADFFLDFLHGHTLYMGERLAATVDLSEITKLMDVGGGSGAVSIALCRANPKLHSVVLDLPAVVVKTSEHIATAGLQDRIRAQVCDVFSGDFPSDCDGAVIANFLHDFSEERARTILARVASALPSGARLVVMEMAPNNDRTAPPIPVAFSLAMIVNSEGGDAYTVPQYTTWIDDAGFEVKRILPLDGSIVTTAIEARKR